MTFNQVIRHFGGISQTANALGVSYQAVFQWRENKHIPQGRQWQIQALTGGKLKAANDS